MFRGTKASTTVIKGFLCPHYGISAVDGHMRKSVFSDDDARPDSIEHGAVRVRVQTQFSML